jgi:hypothetical protein
MPVNREALLKDLQKQVVILEDDLRDRAGEPDFDAKLRPEWERAKKAERVAATYETWLDGQVTQSAVAWVLASVFVRFCEDNRLLAEPWLAGPGERLQDASDRQQEYYRQNPSHTAREWMIAAFHHMAESNRVVAGLFDEAHNPLWRITPNEDISRGLVAFWRLRGDDGEIIHDFSDPQLDTRFLGDLYQDLSEHAKSTYALLQTPDFVEEFILDRTLGPALKEFGIDARYPAPEGLESRTDLQDGLRVIDPTCGSGHFLLGAFQRLLRAWEAKAPGLDRWEQIARALYGVHGVDKNPFAVAIARFRLLLAAMQAHEIRELTKLPNWQINIAVGDSLLHGRRFKQEEIEGLAGLEVRSEEEVHTFDTEDVKQHIASVDILGNGSYHVVVGNPPYITVKDKGESQLYKDLYETCYRKYSLSVPFAERFFQLGVRVHNEGNVTGSGFVGQITANSFMKREFGKKLIEVLFHSQVNLTELVDTSGAYIPGHGTPTVIIIGRNAPRLLERPVRAVLGLRGEPNAPQNPSEGLVWNAIINQVDRLGSESEWVSVSDIDRTSLAKHPWSLSGGGADALLTSINQGRTLLRARNRRIGVFGITAADDVMIAPRHSWVAVARSLHFTRPIVAGENLRDWGSAEGNWVFFPYDSTHELRDLSPDDRYFRWMWPHRTVLGNRSTFGKKTYFEENRPWYEWHQLPRDKEAHGWTITFAGIGTHGHFVMDRGGRVFNRWAPVIKLPEGSSEDDHLELLGVLNSSTACFWLKQVSHNKGSTVDQRGARQTAIPWEDFYEFTGTKLQEFPLPQTLPLRLARELDDLAQKLAGTEPAAVCSVSAPTADHLVKAGSANLSIRRSMIALQEELDWQVYGYYGLLKEGEAEDFIAPDPDAIPELDLGQRAFEIVMARRMASGDLDTPWFDRHGSTPITEILSHWPDWYQALVARRIEKIESDRSIGLIERPECKRRWAQEPWNKRAKGALRNYILDACEDRSLWYAPAPGGIVQARPQTVYTLADRLRSNPDVAEAARLYSGSNTDLSKVLEEIIKDEHVPFLAAMRYKLTGLRKRAQWERTWELQREEDATGTRLDIPVPPKYTSADFLKTSYWRHRGKLDVPKERFISYPGASPDQDGSLLLGWAGWDHKDQAVALVNLVHDRKTKSAWEADRLTPLLAGLAELMPWLRQWFAEPDPALGGYVPADMFDQALRAELSALGLTEEALAAWRPAKTTRGKKSAR